jgi:hypothetical protein
MGKKKSERRPKKSALDIGRSLARDTLKRRSEAAATRKRGLASLETKRKGVRAKAGPAPESRGVLIAEGDSWFDYPFSDVLDELEDRYGYDVESVAHRGHTVESMAYADGQLDDFARRVEKVLRRGATPKAILLSGGGNDIAGDEFAILLDHALSGTAGFNESIVRGVIDERLRDAYVTILSAITALCESQIGKAVPLIVHGYDWAVPDGRGFAGGWGPLPGPWLEPGFRRKGYGSRTERQRLITVLIDRFNAMLARLVAQAPFSHVRYLDLRGTLPNGAGYKKYWANELHPTPRGFRDVTAKFAALL